MKRFHGGVHPCNCKKELSAVKAIEQMPAPAKVILSLQQHTGGPSKPLVEVGQEVARAESPEASSFISASYMLRWPAKSWGSLPIPTRQGVR